MLRLFFFVFALLAASSVSARMTERTDPAFRVETDLLEKGQVHYAHRQLAASEVLKSYPEYIELDGARFFEREGASVEISKLAYVVNRPAGFFSSTQTTDPAWLQKLLGGTVSRLKEDHYDSQALGKFRVYFDSDDLSTLQNTRFVHAVTQSKKLDPIALSGFSTVIIHAADYVQIDNHVPLTPSKTLIVSYQLAVVRKDQQKARDPQQEFLRRQREKLVRAFP